MKTKTDTAEDTHAYEFTAIHGDTHNYLKSKISNMKLRPTSMFTELCFMCFLCCVRFSYELTSHKQVQNSVSCRKML